MLLMLAAIFIIVILNQLDGTKTVEEQLREAARKKQQEEDDAFVRRVQASMSDRKEPVYSTTNPLLKGIPLSDPKMHDI